MIANRWVTWKKGWTSSPCSVVPRSKQEIPWNRHTFGQNVSFSHYILYYSLWRGNCFTWLCFLCCRRQQKYVSRYPTHSTENLTKNSWCSHLYWSFLQETWGDKSRSPMNPSLLHSSIPQISQHVLNSVFPMIKSQVTK